MTIRASRARSLLVALLAAGAVRALVLCELPALPLTVAVLAVLSVAARDILSARRPATLSLDGDGRWRLDSRGDESFTGRLVESGYRSAALLVIELERVDVPVVTGPTSERPRVARAGFGRGRTRRRLAIFADGVDAADFSFLHLQLAFVATSGPSR